MFLKHLIICVDNSEIVDSGYVTIYNMPIPIKSDKRMGILPLLT